MRIGVCLGADQAARAKAAGCDYLELNFTNIARQSETEFEETQTALDAAGLRAEAMNCFIPGDFQLFSLENEDELRAYLQTGFARAKQLGTEIVVFGSSKARCLPKGVQKAEGVQKLVKWFSLAAALAGEAGRTVVIEPLRRSEDNAVNTLREGLALMEQVNSPYLRLLADMYHMGENGEDFDDILLAGENLRHCHIGRPAGRKYPLPGDGYDYAPFFAALNKINYAGRLSIEASPVNGPDDLPISAAYLKGLAG